MSWSEMFTVGKEQIFLCYESAQYSSLVWHRRRMGEIFLSTDKDKIIGGKKVNHLCCDSISIALQTDFSSRFVCHNSVAYRLNVI